MVYLKCPWCGNSHNRFDNKCQNCGGVLTHKSELHKQILNNQNLNVFEIINLVKKIKRILTFILLIVVSIAFYFLYQNISYKSHNILSVKNVVYHYPQSFSPTRQIPIGTKIEPKLEENKSSKIVEQTPCRLEIDKSLKPNVYLVSQYHGLKNYPIQFGLSGHEVKLSEVIINKPGERIVLVLMAYDPVVWKVKKTINTSVLGVVLAGYHEQRMIGLPKTTPVLEANYETKTACNYFYDNLASGGQKFYILRRIEEIVGELPIELITKPDKEMFYVGSSVLTDPLIEYSTENNDIALKKQLQSEGVEIDGIAPNEQGINQLLREGKIRMASTTDIDNWSKISSQHRGGGRHHMREGRTYVVMKPIQFPRGMYGAHSRDFILEENVPIPTGEIAHNTLYIMENGVCMGFPCGAY